MYGPANRRRALCAATALVWCLAGVAAAQTATSAAPPSGAGGGDRLNEVVVTARRTSESLQRTPVAVTAITGGTLDKLNIQAVDKISEVTPNLVISQQTSSLTSASINIRGIGQTEPSLAQDPGVGVYLDGVYVARTAGAILDLVDLQRIEVLRGPQGTLFGRNTTGGAIQLITQKPTNDFHLEEKGGYGNYNEWYTRTRIDTGRLFNTPFTASIAYLHRQHDGYVDNTLTPDDKDPGALDVNAGFFALHGDITKKFTLDYSYDYDDRTGVPNFFQIVATTPDIATYFGKSPQFGGAPFVVNGDTRLTTVQQEASTNGQFTSESVSQGQGLTLQYAESPALTLKSITGYRKLYMFNVLGLSGEGNLKGVVLDPTTFTPSIQPVSLYNGYNGPQRQFQFSEELQALGGVGDFKYVGGLYYFHEQVQESLHQFLTYVLPGGQAALNLTPNQAYFGASSSRAVFGQVSYRPSFLAQKFELTFGGRYTSDKKLITLNDTEDGVSTVTGPSSGEVSFDNFSYLVSASYQFTRDIMAYGRVSTGYKSGGFNARASSLNAFAPEKATAYEVGLKSEFLDHRLRADVAGFYTDYTNLQVQQFASGTGGATTLLVNAGKANFKGFELELTALPVERLSLSGSLGYTDPTYQSFLFRDPTTNVVSNVADVARFPNVAKLNAHLGAEYDFPPIRYGTPQIRADYSYRSQVYFYPLDSVNPFNQDVKAPAQNNLSARIALTDITVGESSKLELSLYGDNLTNENHISYGIDFGGLGFGGVQYGDPRRYGFDLKFDF